MQSGILRIVIVGLVLLVTATLLLRRPVPPPPEGATELAPPLALVEVELVDQHGAAFRTADLTGRFSLLFFGFTHCPDVCPLTMHVLARALEQLEDGNVRTMPSVVLVSVDPERDTPARLREYVGNFHPDFDGVTGSEQALAPLLTQLGISVMKHSVPGGSYTVTHNSQVFVLGPKAEVIAIIGKAEDPDSVVSDFSRIRQRYTRGLLGTAGPR